MLGGIWRELVSEYYFSSHLQRTIICAEDLITIDATQV